jgi:hypothetical protein
MGLTIDDMKHSNDIKLSHEIQLFIPIQYSVKKHIYFYQTLNKVVAKLKSEIPRIEKLRNEPEFCLLICILIENILPKKAGIDKKILVINILEELFLDLTVEEKQQYKMRIQYDYDNKSYKRIPAWKYIFYNIGKLIHDFFFLKQL